MGPELQPWALPGRFQLNMANTRNGAGMLQQTFKPFTFYQATSFSMNRCSSAVFSVLRVALSSLLRSQWGKSPPSLVHVRTHWPPSQIPTKAVISSQIGNKGSVPQPMQNLSRFATLDAHCENIIYLMWLCFSLAGPWTLPSKRRLMAHSLYAPSAHRVGKKLVSIPPSTSYTQWSYSTQH